MKTEAAVAAFAVAASVLGTLGGLWSLSKVAWAKLAARYAWEGPLPAPRTRGGYGWFNGWCGYKGCLVVAADEQALYLSLWRLLSPFHPPLRIPWSELTVAGPAKVFWRRCVELRFKALPDLRLALSQRTYDAVQDEARRSGAAAD